MKFSMLFSCRVGGKELHLCEAFADFVEDGLVLDVVFVVSLEFGGDAVQSAL